MHTKESKQQDLNARAQRLWGYRIQEENVFYQRINFFLLAESMLFVAFATVVGGDGERRLFVHAIGWLGVLLTTIWLYVNRRQKRVYEHLRRYVEEACPEYKDVRSTRPKAVLSSWWIMTYMIPGSMLAAWIALLVSALVQSSALICFPWLARIALFIMAIVLA